MPVEQGVLCPYRDMQRDNDKFVHALDGLPTCRRLSPLVAKSTVPVFNRKPNIHPAKDHMGQAAHQNQAAWCWTEEAPLLTEPHYALRMFLAILNKPEPSPPPPKFDMRRWQMVLSG